MLRWDAPSESPPASGVGEMPKPQRGASSQTPIDWRDLRPAADYCLRKLRHTRSGAAPHIANTSTYMINRLSYLDRVARTPGSRWAPGICQPPAMTASDHVPPSRSTAQEVSAAFAVCAKMPSFSTTSPITPPTDPQHVQLDDATKALARGSSPLPIRRSPLRGSSRPNSPSRPPVKPSARPPTRPPTRPQLSRCRKTRNAYTRQRVGRNS